MNEMKRAKAVRLTKLYRKLWLIAMILIGNTLYALGVVLFILPNGLITGGTTGLGLFLEHSLGIPLSAFVAVFNVAMFLLGAGVLGGRFALTTALSTFYYPLAFHVLSVVLGDVSLTADPMLATLCAGLLIGAGMGLVIHAGASTGGMDIPPLVLNRLLGLPVSIGLYAFDFVILILQMFFSNAEQILYGCILVLIYTVVLDRMLVIGKSQLEVKIVSPCHEQINRVIRERLDRGVTLLHSQGGFSEDESMVVLTVLSRRELVTLNHLVADIDPDAFLIISQVNEVRGRGFTLDKKYRKR